MVGPGGLEPPRAYAHWILSPMRLPVPPRPPLEVPVRFELTVTELQSVALPNLAKEPEIFLLLLALIYYTTPKFIIQG